MKHRIPGRISFVIPTRNNQRTIAACVSSAATQTGDVEVLVVDNHSNDGTARSARAAGADVVIVAGPERSAQRNRGFEASTGEVVVFIDSDMVLEPGLSDALRGVFTDEDVAGAVLPEAAFGEGYLAASRALEKRLALGDPVVEAARAFRAEVLEQVGGYEERFFGFEDYELADRASMAGRISRSAIGVRHDEGRITVSALLRKKHYYGTQWSQARVGLRPHRMHRRRIPASVLVHDASHVPGLVLLKAVDSLGLLAGAADSALRRRVRGRSFEPV